LTTHAFFKGLLFLAAGSVIHAVSGEQDMRQMGGLRTKIPWTFWTMTIATFAIAGIPPFAGFFSKDEILWRAYQASWVYWFIGLFTAFVTSFYMFRLWFMTFGEYRERRRIRITNQCTILPLPTRGPPRHMGTRWRGFTRVHR
jgi:NADH-quinone oxidoreductase subunit L